MLIQYLLPAIDIFADYFIIAYLAFTPMKNLVQSANEMTAPTLRREEGLLYRVSGEVGEGSVDHWVKKWYRSHEKAASAPIEQGFSMLSPFWARQKELEIKLINELFPNCTVKMEGSHDERVEGNNFDLLKGRPATVTQHVETGNQEVFNIMMEIINETYGVLIPAKDKMMKSGGITLTPNDPFFKEWRERIDARIQAVLGQDLDMGSVVSGLEGFAKRVVELKKRNPNTTIIDLLEAGIVPIHTQLNFIPCNKDTHPRSPHGTFLEFRIYDVNKLSKTAEKTFGKDARRMDSFNENLLELIVGERLDTMFDNLVLYTHYGRLDQSKFHPAFQTALYKLLKVVGLCIQGRFLRDADLPRLEEHIKNSIKISNSPQEIPYRLYDIQSSLEKMMSK